MSGELIGSSASDLGVLVNSVSDDIPMDDVRLCKVSDIDDTDDEADTFESLRLTGSRSGVSLIILMSCSSFFLCAYKCTVGLIILSFLKCCFELNFNF